MLYVLIFLIGVLVGTFTGIYFYLVRATSVSGDKEDTWSYFVDAILFLFKLS